METNGKVKSLIKLKLRFRKNSDRIMDIILPPPGSLSHQMDSHLWQKVKYLDAPCCHACGFPFEYDRGERALCAKCMVNQPDFDQARAAFEYHEDCSALILAFKHAGRTVNLDRFARQLKRAGRDFWHDADMLIPVPLHKKRLFKRKYNQAALLAGALSKITHIPQRTDLLIRHKATASQGIQTAKGRFRNVRGAFTIAEQSRKDLQDKSVILIDDVYTTGATLNACARSLRRAGAKEIKAVTLARVVNDQEIIT